MNRIAAIAAVVLVAASSVRADDAITVRATPVASGTDPSALFDQQLAAEIAPSAAPCATGSGCGSTVVREQRVGGDTLVQVRRAEIFGGAPHGDRGPDDQLLLRRHGRWYALGTLPLSEEECGAGSCTTQTITAIRARGAGAVLWITLRERTTRAATDPRSCLQGCPPSISYADLVFAFFPSATPLCARVFTLAVFPDHDIFDRYSARVAGHVVVMRWQGDGGSKTKRVVVHAGRVW